MVKAGQLRHKLQFQRKGDVPDEYGNVKSDWADLFATRGNVREQRGNERIKVGATENVRQATIRLRKNSNSETVTEADRVIARGETWNILGIAHADDKGAMLDMLCEAVGG